VGKDHTLFALVDGFVRMTRHHINKKCNVVHVEKVAEQAASATATATV
jgi:ribosomal protein L27